MAELLCPKCGKPVIKGGMRNDKYGKSGTQRYMHGEKNRVCKWHGTQPIGLEEEQSAGVDRALADALHGQLKKERGPRRYVITSAQNATPVHKRFFDTLLTYCRANKAQLIVIPYRYKNPTSMWSEKAEHDDWWAPELAPYILDRRIDINENLVLLADIKTQPTANSPLTGFETLTGAKSGIIGHPKIELVTVPTPQSRMAKILTTTGAVTEPNYIPSKAGAKGLHHHTFGACVVEVQGKLFHTRQINALRDGSFCELENEYSGKTITPRRLKGLVMGDSHVEFIEPRVVAATFGEKGITESLGPEYLVWHDVHDFYSANHHHRGEVFIRLVKHRTGRDNVRKWLQHTFDFVDRHTPAGVTNVFVPSNHPDALARWVKETDPRTDLENCVFWAETFKAMADSARMTKTGASTVDPFTYWAKRMMKTAGQTVFLKRDQSFQLMGIELGFHGDAGPNGSRGTRNGFTKVGTKVVIGHSHSPGIKDGVYQVGTSSRLGLEYQRGPSSWLHTHCLIYANGKRSLVNIIDGQWRLFL